MHANQARTIPQFPTAGAQVNSYVRTMVEIKQRLIAAVSHKVVSPGIGRVNWKTAPRGVFAFAQSRPP